jgi:hypothetical protein
VHVDSSFDTIVHVDYLKLSESKQLLKRRTTRIAEPFLCLCHCLSGGLPRDLIRTCRDLLDIAALEAVKDLLPVARLVITQECHAKARAMTTATTKLSAADSQTEFLSQLTELLTEQATEQSLLSRAGQLLAAADALRNQVAKMSSAKDGSALEEATNLIGLADLQSEFGLYLGYVATVLEVMSYAEASGTWQQLEVDTAAGRNVFDKLASTRQALAVSASVGRQRLAQLRSAQGLAATITAPLPAAPLPPYPATAVPLFE